MVGVSVFCILLVQGPVGHFYGVMQRTSTVYKYRLYVTLMRFYYISTLEVVHLLIHYFGVQGPKLQSGKFVT